MTLEHIINQTPVEPLNPYGQLYPPPLPEYGPPLPEYKPPLPEYVPPHHIGPMG